MGVQSRSGTIMACAISLAARHCPCSRESREPRRGNLELACSVCRNLRPGGMRACPAGLPVKAHAPVASQVSNIRLWPSPRVDIGRDDGPKHTERLRAIDGPRPASTCPAANPAAVSRPVTKPVSEPDHQAAAASWMSDPATDDRFDTVYRTEAPRLLRFFRRQLRSPEDAQDLAQETMLRFLRVAPSTQVATPQAYLRRIAINLLRDRIASSATKLERSAMPLLEGLDRETDFDQHRILAGRQELAEWELILAKLKPRTLEIFLLSRIDGYTYGDIADHLGMTIWNVKRHMIKAIAHVERHRGRR